MSEQQPQRAPVPADGATLLRRFEHFAEVQPRAPLVVYGEWRLSYRDVNAAANRLAHRLIALGVGRNVPVGLCLDRGPDLLVAILAVLKAGGAYVPLDPQWPADRLRRMQDAAAPAALVTRTDFRRLLSASGTAAILDLDRDQAAIAGEGSANPDLTVDESQWCYVLFTSGSTGTPKGVPITHANLAGLFPPLTATLGFGPGDVWTWFHSASFGFSAWELWGALVHGGCLVIVPERIRQDPAALGELIADEGVTVFSQTPSAYRRVLHDDRFHGSVQGSRLRYLALSGEAIRRDDIAGWLARGHGARLINTYAITETAGQLTLRIYGAGDATEEGARNLGYPLAGREVLVLDAAGRPVDDGTAGELWVGGACVTPGYLAAPELADRFAQLAVPGAGVVRGYRTGDRVRRLPDGALEYLGRVDAQLKFRGYRIEPGDIEAALRAHPAVRDAAVGLRADPLGNQRLTAWVVASDAPALPTAEFWPSLGAYGIYDQWLYGLMNAEPVRLAAYRAAFAAAVPGKVVLDIGTGEDAVLARLCIEAGAAHVYAVEVLPAAARRAAELVQSLGLGDRITVIEGDIAGLDLPRPVEVCTQGIIGNIGSADGIAGIWNAARRHFAPECVPVPEICTTRIAALELPSGVRTNPRFGPLAAEYTRRLFAAEGQPFDLRLCLRNVTEADLLTPAAEFEVLDFNGELATLHAGEAELAITRDGLLDGCLLWTVVTASPGHTVDYFREQQAWLPVYLPLADEPLPVRQGDRLHLEWQSRLDSDVRFPDYSVTARLAGASGTVVFSHVSRHRSVVAGGTRLHRQLLGQLDGTSPAPPERLSVTELRRWLDARVPEHLVPQSWVFLPELPLGPGGKLDRDALPAPGANRPRLAAEPVAPRSAAEHALANLWTEVLGIDAPGVEDDFFELGGDSIAAVQLTTRLQRWLDAGVPLAALFEAPTIARLVQHLEQHFAQSLAAALARAASPPAVVAAPASATTGPRRVPLTYSQQSLWFLHTLYPGDTSASEQFAIRLRGPLDVDALGRAWEAVIRRHPVLAACFEADAETGTWLISADGIRAGRGHRTEIRHVPIATEAELTRLAEAALREPFDLAHGPLVRAVLCRFSASSHVLLVTAHHIIADGMSVPVLQADLARFYSGTDGSELPPATAYADLAEQPAWQQGLDAPAALAWWRQRLANLPPPALQELVRPAPGERLSRRVPFTLDAGLADGLRRLARAANATPYMALLAAFRTLLVRLTGQPDICIGTPMTLRDTPELRDVVGCLVNPVVLRVTVDLARSFQEQLQAERAGALEAFQHRAVPFSRVVQAVSPERQLGVHPVFQILFSWEPAMPALTGVEGMEFAVVPVPAARASYFDLECSLRDAGEGAPVSGYFAWSTQVLEDWVAEQLPGCLLALLADVVARPEVPLQDVALMDAGDRRCLLVDWNATAAPLPAEPTLHEWFLAQAGRTPDAVALRAGPDAVSYGALAGTSLALAAELLSRGVRGRNVGIALGRSTDLVVAVLAVLRAGGTVVPLDPGFPVARLRFIADDAGLALLLVAGQPEQGAPPTTPVFDLAAWKRQPVSAAGVLPVVEADTAAMMLYTSGSTGEPKGAQSTHRSAVNRCHWMWRTFGFGDDEVFALRTSLNFIDAWWEIFGALGHGVPVQIVPDDVATDPLRLPDFLAASRVTQLVLVPSLLRALLEQVAVTGVALPALRWCITSGEPLLPGLVAEFRRLLPGATLLNTYGTSEIWDATAFDTRHLAPGALRVPIGHPIANTRVYVVDAAGAALPPGIPGELQVAGPGVGPGYWRRPALTADKFGQLALPGLPAERVYRTGDRARFLADGSVECLGRLDAQFKLRGLRIEPAEIEQALRAHPAVGNAVVGLVGEGSGAAVAAGIVRSMGWAAPDGASLAAVLSAHLQASLPSWMVPTAWCELDALPLTPTGKVDRRRALSSINVAPPAMAGSGDTAEAGGQPRTGTERELAGLWVALLGRAAVGVHDNFFHLGGHSLLAARLLTRVRATFGVQVALRELFAAPTVGALAAVIDARRQSDAAPATLLPGLSRADGDDTALLSYGQERLWFLEQLDPGSPAYNVAWTVRCTGPLPVATLRAALDALVARHPALRTRFPSVGGRPAAVVDPPLPLPLDVRDLTAAAEPAAELARQLTVLAREAFDLERGPLFRATLLKTGDTDHHLLLVAQHIVTDATSNHVLFADLAAALAAMLDAVQVAAGNGGAPAWPDLPVSYGEFARRQRAQAGEPRQKAELDWWRQRLAGAPPALELPTDRPRPPEQRFAGGWVQRPVPAGVAADVRRVALEHGCTPFMVLLAAFKAVLQRYTGTVDVLVGTPVEGRLAADVEQVVGLFINTLVMRTDLSGDPAFSELLRRVRDTTLDAQAHQEAPFEQLVEILAPERSLTRSPVFQVMFNLVQLPPRVRRAGELALRVDRLIDQGVSSFDLTLTAAVDDEGLALTFEYATDLFDASTIGQLADAYLTLLQGALRDPGELLSRLPLLDAAARERVLALGRAAHRHASGAVPFEPVHRRVSGLARQSPDAVAVELGGRTLSYATLEARASQLARHLLELGLGQGSRVGICLPRTPDYLVAVLAVLKAGAAYVPLDPDYPPERLAVMAGDAQLSGLISLAVTGSAPRVAGPRLNLDADEAAIARRPATDPAVPVQAGEPAYVLFTSGSTGRPKGVVVSHGSLAGMRSAWQSAYGLQPGEAHLQMASAAFDVFTGDWVRALGTGGRLVLCPRDVVLDPPALLGLLRSAGIGVAEFVPAVIRLLLEHCRSAGESLPGLRLLIVGSDSWYGSELAGLRRLSAPGTRVINSYGVAEATIDSTWFEAGTRQVDGPVPIGTPFPGVSVQVLDAEGEPVPRGVPGELCIGGVGVAAGYWNDPELTAQKFRRDPYSGVHGARLYRTGDRARWNGAGQLELLGRSDAQFKLRGFRIEPAEVEAAILTLPGISAAAVGLLEVVAGEPQLAAWIVAGDQALSHDRLQGELGRLLPSHLVPAVFIAVDALPLTPNGKVDRGSLRSLPVGAAAAATDCSRASVGVAAAAAPTTEIEHTLCRLFTDVLRVNAGAHTDFFRAGGHSLLATRLVARLREELQSEVPLRLLFEAPTPRGLAAALADHRAVRGLPVPAPAPRARAPGEPVPLSLMQQRLWFLERLHPGTAMYHLHWLLRLRGPLDEASLQSAVAAVVARHEVLRTVFVERSGVPGQRVLAGVRIPLEVLVAGAAGPDLNALVARPFDLAKGPLLRTTLLADGPEEHRLLVVMHHLVCDGWSFGILARELAAAYNAAHEGRPSDAVTADLPVQYADYALWQQDALASGRLDAQLDYWRDTLAGAPPLLALPTDAERAPMEGAAGEWATRTVAGATLGALRELALDQGCTLFMVLQAGFKAVLGRLAGTDDVVIGTPIAGRSHRVLEDLIGFFVNTVVLRTGLQGDPTFRDLLARVRDTTLQAFGNPDVPFEKLVEVLRPGRSLVHSPLVQVLFALHNQPRQALVLAGLQASVETIASETVKFDLNLHAAEEEGELELALAWRTGLYGAEAMHGLLDCYVQLLGAVAADPDLPLSQLLRVTPAPGRGPALAITAAAQGSAPHAPDSPAELAAGAVLQGLWAALLGRRDFGSDDDFFSLGGHSLLATRLVAGIADRLGVELPLISVFEAPTIRALARRVVARQVEVPTAVTAIRRLPRRPDRGDGL